MPTIPNHADLARQAFDASALPDPPRPLDAALRYITLLLASLPVAEDAGYVRSFPGGENTLPLPDGTPVRVSRVIYPNGELYKVLNDAPNGNPQWVLEEEGRSDLYVPYGGPHDTPTEPPPPSHELEDRLTLLEGQVRDLIRRVDGNHDRVEAINTRFADESARLNVHHPLPEYVGRAPLFGGTVTSRPKP